MSGPGGSSLWLFFEHEQRSAVAAEGGVWGVCREEKESLVAIRTAVRAGPGLNFVQNHSAVKPSWLLTPLTSTSLSPNGKLSLRG